MAIRPRNRSLPSFNRDNLVANICKDFARPDKIEICFKHRIQYTNDEALRRYVDHLTRFSALFQPCRRRNINRDAANTSEYITLPYQYRIGANEMVSGGDIKIQYNRSYPRNIRDMEMRYAINFQRFWQQNEQALSYPIRRLRNQRKVILPEDVELRDLFTRSENNFAWDEEAWIIPTTNLLRIDRWHQTKDVQTLLSKQILLLRDFIESQFHLSGNLSHVSLQRQYQEIETDNSQTIYCLPDNVIEQAGGAVPIFNWADFNLPYMEIAYDMRSTDAMQVVQDLMTRALGVAFSTSAGFHDIYFAREDNIPSFNIRLTKNVTCAIYAKTYDRVRVELRYKGSIHSILRRKLNKDMSLENIVDVVTDDATNRAIKLLTEMPPPPEEPLDRTKRMVEFIQHINHAFANDNRLEIFLNALAICGSHIQHNNGNHEPFRYLVSQGILQTSRPGLRNTTVQYSIAPEYAWIIQTLGARYFG